MSSLSENLKSLESCSYENLSSVEITNVLNLLNKINESLIRKLGESNTSTSDKLLSMKEVLSLLNVSETTLRNWDESGKLVPTERTEGGHRRYSASTIAEFMKKNSKTEKDNLQEIEDRFMNECETCFSKMVKLGILEPSSEYNDKALALTLENQTLSTRVLNTSGAPEIDLIKNFWKNLITKDIVTVKPALGPAGKLTYNYVFEKSIMEEDYSVKIRSCKHIKLIEGADQSFTNEMIAISLAQELDDEIIQDLSNNSQKMGFDWQLRMLNCISKPNKPIEDSTCKALITNKKGLLLLKNFYKDDVVLPTMSDILSLNDSEGSIVSKKVGSLYGVDVIFNPKVNKFLLTYKGKTPMDCGYFFMPYIVYTPTPLTISDINNSTKGFTSRYAKKLVRCGSNYYKHFDF